MTFECRDGIIWQRGRQEGDEETLHDGGESAIVSMALTALRILSASGSLNWRMTPPCCLYPGFDDDLQAMRQRFSLKDSQGRMLMQLCVDFHLFL